MSVVEGVQSFKILFLDNAGWSLRQIILRTTEPQVEEKRMKKDILALGEYILGSGIHCNTGVSAYAQNERIAPALALT
jgi:hypothetical protein